jgi:hypothetical protein
MTGKPEAMASIVTMQFCDARDDENISGVTEPGNIALDEGPVDDWFRDFRVAFQASACFFIGSKFR